MAENFDKVAIFIAISQSQDDGTEECEACKVYQKLCTDSHYCCSCGSCFIPCISKLPPDDRPVETPD